MRIGAVVLTRLDSTRLPGKALAEINGHPLIWYCLERLKASRSLDSIVIATTDRPVDAPISDYAQSEGFQIVRGAASDVAGRFLQAGISYQFDAIIRINADCPLLDVELLDKACKIMRNNDFDIITNIFPRTFPFGIIVEVVKTEAFIQGYSRMTAASEFEHVTKHFYDTPNSYNIKNLAIQSQSAERMLNYRFTVDTVGQLQAFRRFVATRKQPWVATTFEEGLAFGGFGF